MESRTERPVAAAHEPIVERRYLVPFAIVTTLFLSWAFAASLNDVLIRHFQGALDLTRGQSSLIQLAFYIGYFCAAIPAGIVIRRFGYKNGILTGLALYAVGAFLFYPAAEVRDYGIFLFALYIIAFGLAFLETSANPYVTLLGAPATGPSRLNLAQSFYGVGAIAGPIVGGLFIFSGTEKTKGDMAAMSPGALDAYRAAEAATVQMPYLAIGIVVCFLAVAVAFTRFPAVERRNVPTAALPFRILRNNRLRWAVVTQFFYVGAQVGVWSFFIDFSKDIMPSLPERQIAFLLSASLGMLMIGRFSGAFIQRRIAPAKLLALYAVANIILCLTASISHGVIAIGALWLTSFFMSIMFPTIFALGIENLGEESEMGSSFLIMSIIGGALIPPGMGLLADKVGAQLIMVVPALCFGVCLAFALRLPSAEARS